MTGFKPSFSLRKPGNPARSSHALPTHTERNLAHDRQSKRWPKGSNALSNAIRKVSPSLRENGISVTFPGPTGHSRSRQIEILSIPAEDKGKRSSASSDETLFSPEKIKGDPADDRPERPDDADDFFPLSSAERPNSEEEVFEL